jgi:serine/threonine-protein kinase
LRAAAASCSALQAPIDHTRAQLDLGRALEQTGDAGGACAAYKIVIDRWGAAKPRSVTADFARVRRRALACH